MNIELKNTLREYRRKKNVTQEQLAEHLGISSQAVSKWERGEGLPDIALLPAIALYFGVTIDDLLNVGQARIDAMVKGWQDESQRLKNAGENAKNLALWEAAYAEMPNDCRVMAELMNAINRRAHRPCPPEEAERIIALGERILEESKDTELRENAIQRLCYTYDSIGDRENALRYAKMGGSVYTTRDDLISFVLDGETGVKATQEYLVALIALAVLAIGRMSTQGEYSRADRIRLNEAIIGLWLQLFSDGNVGFYAHDISYRYAVIAMQYAELKDAEGTLAALEDCARYAVRAVESNRAAVPYTALLVDRLSTDPERTTKNYKGNACNNRLTGLGWKGYDFVREDERFRRVEEILRANAEKCPQQHAAF